MVIIVDIETNDARIVVVTEHFAFWRGCGELLVFVILGRRFKHRDSYK